MNTTGRKLSVIALWTVAGACFCPLITCTFLSFEPSEFSVQAILSSFRANLLLFVVVAIVCGIVGLGIGVLQAVLGRSKTPFE